MKRILNSTIVQIEAQYGKLKYTGNRHDIDLQLFFYMEIYKYFAAFKYWRSNHYSFSPEYMARNMNASVSDELKNLQLAEYEYRLHKMS